MAAEHGRRPPARCGNETFDSALGNSSSPIRQSPNIAGRIESARFSSSEAIKRGDAGALDRRFTGPPRSIRKLALKVSAIGLNREGFQMRRFILVASAIVGMLTIVPLATPAQAQQNQWCSKFKGW